MCQSQSAGPVYDLVQSWISFDWLVNRLQPTWASPVGSGPVFLVYVKYKNQFQSWFCLKEGENWDWTGLSSTMHTTCP